jgi:hypothetical protein
MVAAQRFNLEKKNKIDPILTEEKFNANQSQ